jgi:ammonia channel protein AmtB
MTIPTYLPFYVLAGTAGIIATVLFGLNLALARADWPAHDRTRTVGATALILMGWLGAAIALGAAGAFHASSSDIPTIQYGVFLPILISALMIWRSPLVTRIIDAVPQHWIVSVQLYRALGVIFLILYATGKLPGLFAWPAGVGDILIGVLAPVVGLAYARDPQKNGDLVAAWNVFGIGDLVIAVATRLLSAPSLVQPFAVEPPNELITQFPLVLIPVFLVPLSILLHLASLAKLRRSAAQGLSRREMAIAAA